jgi:hypothetical protein
MISLASISLGSYQTGTILLAGLFCYDIFWVFGTYVMMTVATSVEAPVKFLYTAPPPLDDIPRVYPFSVLGLGDVVIQVYLYNSCIQWMKYCNLRGVPTLLFQHVPMLLDYCFALWQMISFIMDNQHCYTLICHSLLVHSLARR